MLNSYVIEEMLKKAQRNLKKARLAESRYVYLIERLTAELDRSKAREEAEYIVNQ